MLRVSRRHRRRTKNVRTSQKNPRIKSNPQPATPKINETATASRFHKKKFVREHQPNKSVSSYMRRRMKKRTVNVRRKKPQSVSVLMVTHNTNPSLLKEAVTSVLSQQGVNYELVVVDDGSSNRTTIRMLKSLEKKPRVRILWREHAGIVAARNAGLMASNSHLIAVLDPDAVMVPGRLKEQVFYMRRHPGVAVLAGQMEYINSGSKPTDGGKQVGKTQFKLLPKKFIWDQGLCISHSTVCFRKAAVMAVGGYYSDQPNYEAQDFDLWCKLDINRYQLVVLDKVFCKYRIDQDHPPATCNLTQAMKNIGSRYKRELNETKRNHPKMMGDKSTKGTDAVFFNNGIGNFIQATPFIQNLKNPRIFIDDRDPRFSAIKSISIWPVYPLRNFRQIGKNITRLFALWGFSPKNLPDLIADKIIQRCPDWSRGQTEARAYLDLLNDPIHFDARIKTEYVGPPKAKVPAKFTIALYNGCHPDWTHKLWPVENIILLARLILKDHDVHFIFFGSQKEAGTGSALVQTLGECKCTNLAGKLTLAQTADVMSRCDFAIGNDTGLMHVADAVGIPGVALFGSTIWSKCKPTNNRFKRIQSKGGGCEHFPCYGKNAQNACKDAVCMKELTPAKAYREICFDQMWNRGKEIEGEFVTTAGLASIKVYLTTYNRPETAAAVLRSLIEQQGEKAALTITVVDDASTRPYTEVKALANKHTFIAYRKFPARNGRAGFWRTYNAIFADFKKNPADFLSVIQDDIVLCEKAYSKALDVWNVVSEDKKAAALSLFRDARFKTIPWRNKRATVTKFGSLKVVKHYWLDGHGWLAPASGLPAILKNKLNGIPHSRWNEKPNLGSGVFPQISDRVMDGKYRFYAPEMSLLKHLTVQSQMNPGSGNEILIREENYIGDSDKCSVEPNQICRCPICDFSGEFSDFGAARRQNALCPKCGSLERHRLLWLYIKSSTNLLKNKNRILHFSPNPALKKKLSSLGNLDYVTSNITKEESMVIDITDMPEDISFFDVIIAVHLLEHIQDDFKAMRELFRVLNPGGRAIIMVPILEPATVEGDSFKGTKEHVDNPDHVRSYGMDVIDRLKAAGFEVEVIDTANCCCERDVVKHGLLDEIIFVCHKPSKL